MFSNLSPPPNKALDKGGKLRVQQVVGSFLYYTRLVNVTILHTMNSIAAESSKPTERTMKHVEQHFDYMHTNTNPTADVHYHASNMILNVHLNVSYLSVSRRRSNLADNVLRRHVFLSLQCCFSKICPRHVATCREMSC